MKKPTKEQSQEVMSIEIKIRFDKDGRVANQYQDARVYSKPMKRSDASLLMNEIENLVTGEKRPPNVSNKKSSSNLIK